MRQILLLTTILPATLLCLTQTYTFTEVLSPVATVRWRADETASTIFIAVTAKTQGWVGLGLSLGAGMLNADMAIAWVGDDGKGAVSDRTTIGFSTRSEPRVDASQDWKLLASNQTADGWLEVELSRAYDTCDPDDVPVTLGTSKVLVAVASTDPVGGKAPFHDVGMWSRSINLRTRSTIDSAVPAGAVARAVAFDTPVTLPAAATYYHCFATRIAKGPATHMVAFDVAVTEAAKYGQFVHHVLLYRCAAPLPDAVRQFMGDCYGTSGGVQPPTEIRQCNGGEVQATWAIGGGLFVFPPDVGLELRSETADVDFVIEVHFSNPLKSRTVVPSVGLTLYETAPRAKTAGIMALGMLESGIMVPPGTTLNLGGVCEAACTSQAVPASGVTAFGLLLHGHNAMKRMAVRQVRGTQELRPLMVDDTYDNGFQKFDHLGSIAIQPGDRLYTTCSWTNSGTLPVYGGLGTTDEMCRAYLMYYPKVQASVCMSNLDIVTALTTFTASVSKQGLKSSDVVAALTKAFSTEDPVQRQNALSAAGITWTDSQSKALVSALTSTPHTTDCSKSTTSGVIPSTVTAYTDAGACKTATPTTPKKASASGQAIIPHWLALAAALAALALALQ
jgi:hypothetical protein